MLANTEALVSLTTYSIQFSPFISLIQPHRTHPCLSLSDQNEAFHWDFYSAQVQKGEAEIFFSPLFEFSKVASLFHSFSL